MSGCGLDLRTELNLNPYRTIIPCLTLRVQLPDSGKNEELGKEAENAPAAPAGPPSPGATPAVLPRAAKEASRAIFAPLLRTPSTLLSMLNPAVKKKVWEAWPIPIPGEGEGAGAPLIPWHRFHAYLIFRAGGSSEPSSGHSSNAKPRQILRVVGQHKETSVIIQHQTSVIHHVLARRDRTFTTWMDGQEFKVCKWEGWFPRSPFWI